MHPSAPGTPRLRSWHRLMIVALCALGLYVGIPLWFRWSVERAQQRWMHHRPSTYQLTLQVGCFCNPVLVGPTRIIVQDHQIQSAIALADGTAVAGDAFRRHAPIEEQFRIIYAQLDTNPWLISAQFDPALGYPTRIDIRGSPGVSDGDVVFLVTDFERLSP